MSLPVLHSFAQYWGLSWWYPVDTTWLCAHIWWTLRPFVSKLFDSECFTWPDGEENNSFFFCLNCLKKHWSVVVNFSFVERTGISEKKIHWKRSMIFPSELWEWFVVFSFYSSRLTLFFEPVCVCVCVCVFCCCFPTGPLASAARFDRVGYGLILKRNPGMKHHLHFCAHLHCPLL